MKMKNHAMIIAVCLIMAANCLHAQKIVVYPVPQQLYYAMHNDDFTVQVREPDGVWQDLYEYNVKVDMDTQSDATFVQFDFTGTVEVRVQKNNGHLQSAVVRPKSKGIVPKINGNVITFTLDKPEDISVECNGDRLHNLHVFANPVETSRPDSASANVMYFAAGLHEPENKESYKIESNTTVYLEPGAVLKGRLDCVHVENVRICGRGFLLTPQQGVRINFSKNIEIDGLTVINPRHYTVSGGQSEGVKISHLRSFSYQGWSDGIDMMCCRDVLIDRVFMRNSDDCVAFYNHRWEFYGGSANITLQNSTLWADIAHPVNIGGHGNPDAEPGETMENVTVRNIDILEHDEDDPPYRGCIAVGAHDRNLVRHILCENIRVENIQEGCLFYVRTEYNSKYDKQPGRGVENVVFRNVSLEGLSDNTLSIVEGYDNARQVRDISFENIVINGKRIKTFAEGSIKVGQFTENINLK
jgi:hypothetical protein